ncbi:hypothetical protein SADUNF_Sadunf13G0030800 [Salix dunnii]|uniref:Uncharacterized protein n=1 Tax=Salix dunnii TaxID=1413687 RepID=A0A835JN67_9ROSI|nr:hypothetical protein SADUNF_Sadunf13G0030800 [Salix dunnii]
MRDNGKEKAALKGKVLREPFPLGARCVLFIISFDLFLPFLLKLLQSWILAHFAVRVCVFVCVALTLHSQIPCLSITGIHSSEGQNDCFEGSLFDLLAIFGPHFPARSMDGVSFSIGAQTMFRPGWVAVISFRRVKRISVRCREEIEMMNHECALAMDAWMREAQEATELVEDVESRIKNRDLDGENRLRDFARSKLIEAGVKLDRLESLLHNPPSKPALTKEDLEFRWKMLSDLQLRTRALALCLYASTKRAGGSLVSETSGTSRATSSLDQGTTLKFNPTYPCCTADQKRKLLSKFDPELLTLLIPEDTAQDQVQFKKSGSFISSSLIKKMCWTFCLILGAAALLFVLVIICAVI